MASRTKICWKQQKFESECGPLQGLHINPGSKKNMKLVVERGREITNIGEQKNLTVQSVLVVDGSPHGMVINDILKKKEYTKQLVTVDGVFHTHKEFVSIVLGIVNDFDRRMKCLGEK